MTQRTNPSPKTHRPSPLATLTQRVLQRNPTRVTPVSAALVLVLVIITGPISAGYGIA